MKDKIFGNLFWKLLSLGLAFLLWLVVMNVINPSSNQSVSGVKVSLENIAYVESMGMTCRLADSSDEVSVTVRGRRRTVERLRAADITAIADMRQIIDISSTPVMVPVTVSVPGISSENISVTPRNIEVVLEEIGSKDFVINPVVTAGTLPSVGYQVGTLSVSPEKVNVRGPESVISKIDKINAEVNVSGIAVDKDLTASIHIIDRNGEELPAVAATCTETGLTAGKKCAVCGEILEAQETVPAAHTMVVHPAVPATCVTTRRCCSRVPKRSSRWR